MRTRLAVLLAIMVTLWPTSAVQAQAARGCAPGQNPSFRAGFAALEAQVGQPVGDPTTCEYPDPKGTGDVEQNTTRGLSFWRKTTNTPTFTDGFNHWALTPRGLVTWTGSSIDPPSAVTAAAPAVPTPANLAKFAGSFGGHGRGLMISSDGAAFVTYRTYNVCGRDPPPCDDFQGNEIIDGGNLTLQLTSATPTVATGQVVSSTDPAYPEGTGASVTLVPNNAVDLRLGDSEQGLFCGPRAPAGYCGA